MSPIGKRKAIPSSDSDDRGVEVAQRRNRRTFLKLAGAAGALPVVGLSRVPRAQTQQGAPTQEYDVFIVVHGYAFVRRGEFGGNENENRNQVYDKILTRVMRPAIMPGTIDTATTNASSVIIPTESDDAPQLRPIKIQCTWFLHAVARRNENNGSDAADERAVADDLKTKLEDSFPVLIRQNQGLGTAVFKHELAIVAVDKVTEAAASSGERRPLSDAYAEHFINDDGGVDFEAMNTFMTEHTTVPTC